MDLDARVDSLAVKQQGLLRIPQPFVPILGTGIAPVRAASGGKACWLILRGSGRRAACFRANPEIPLLSAECAKFKNGSHGGGIPWIEGNPVWPGKQAACPFLNDSMPMQGPEYVLLCRRLAWLTGHGR